MKTLHFSENAINWKEKSIAYTRKHWRLSNSKGIVKKEAIVQATSDRKKSIF